LSYTLDAFLTVEGDRLQWLRTHQSDLMAENYKVLKSYVDEQRDRAANPNYVPEEGESAHPPGRPVILPSTFVGGMRYMQQAYQDAMTIVGRKGPPDLFLTFTCNTGWREFEENIPETQDINFRPDLEALKLDELIYDIRFNHILGVPVAYIYVIEYQKRGHPHAHLLITHNAQQDKILT
jgi:hypothetical protein